MLYKLLDHFYITLIIFNKLSHIALKLYQVIINYIYDVTIIKKKL